jgi:nucleoside-diphosphate-sugar epimerase
MNNPYAYSKTQAEMEVWRGFAEGLKGAIVCPSVILGYGDWNRGSSEIFSRVYKGLGYYTLGVTGFVDVADVVSCMISLMESDIHSERFILNGANLSYKELFEKIAFSFGVKAPSNYARPYMTELAWRLETIKAALTFTQPRITKLISRSAHQQQYYSSAKIQETLNFGFTPIEKTLERIAALYLK